MAWNGSTDAPPTVRIASLAPSLQRSERRVAEAIAADVGAAVDMTAQQLAESVGVGRASVVRTAQTLGFEGYPQLRVALARELALQAPSTADAPGALGIVRAAIDRHARALPHAAASLTEAAVEACVSALDGAPRVLVCANGLSAPLGYDAALRLSSVGRPTEYVPDSLGQRIQAAQLNPSSVLLTVSGSGANQATLDVVDAARGAGATVVAITSFSRSALVDRATTSLIVPPVSESFRDELLLTSRVSLTLVVEALVEALVARRGPRAQAARAAALTVLSHSLGE